MPTRQHPGTRWSRRVQGIAHNLLALPASASTTTASKGDSAKKRSLTKEIAPSNNGDDDMYVPSTDNDDGTSDEEQLEDVLVSSKLHPSKNYTKLVLYDK